MNKDVFRINLETRSKLYRFKKNRSLEKTKTCKKQAMTTSKEMDNKNTKQSCLNFTESLTTY